MKVLPQSLAADPDALARFEREALAVAALSHPNILAIHDFGTQDGTAYAVTELLEGETLRGKLDTGPIAQRQAIDYALQVAKGLSAAHEKGIVHRDLKPENLFVSKDGHLKILDFGLAKKVEAVTPEEKTSARDGLGPHGARDGDGHDGLHVARAGAGTARGSPLGSLLARDDPVRDALGQEGVQAGHGERHDRGDPEGGAAGADAVGAERLAGPRPHRQALPGEGPEPAVPVRAGHRLRALGGVVSDDDGPSGVHVVPRSAAAERRSPSPPAVVAVLAAAGGSALAAPAPRPRAPAAAGGVKRIAVLCRSRTWALPRTTTSPTASRMRSAASSRRCRASRSSRAAARRPTRRRPRRRRRSRRSSPPITC